MKFRCPSCHAKYSLPDEKVRNKILKIRCKRCGTVMILKDGGLASHGEGTGARRRLTPPTGSRVATPPPLAEHTWYLGVGGKQHGPYDSKKLVSIILERPLGPDVLVWRNGMSSWVPISGVPELERWVAYAKAKRRVRRAPTPPPPPPKAEPKPEIRTATDRALEDAFAALMGDQAPSPEAHGPAPLARPPEEDEDEAPTEVRPSLRDLAPDASLDPTTSGGPVEGVAKASAPAQPAREVPGEAAAEPEGPGHEAAAEPEGPGHEPEAEPGKKARRAGKRPKKKAKKKGARKKAKAAKAERQAAQTDGREQPSEPDAVRDGAHTPSAEPNAAPSEPRPASWEPQASPEVPAFLARGVLVPDEAQQQPPGPLTPPPEGPLFPPPSEVTRLTTGEFSVIARIHSANRKILWASIIGIPLVVGGIVFMVTRFQSQWFSPEELHRSEVPVPTDTTDASHRPLYDEHETALTTEDRFTMETVTDGASEDSPRPREGKRRKRRQKPKQDPVSRPKAAGIKLPGQSDPDLSRLAALQRGRGKVRLVRPEGHKAKKVAPAMVTQEISAAVKRNLKSMKRCLDRALKRTGTLEDNKKIVVQFMVQPNGKARKITLSDSIDDGYFERCIGNVIRSIEFPAFSGEARPVRFPLVVTRAGF